MIVLARKSEIFVYGASGHAKVVIDIIERQGGCEIGFLVDDEPVLKGKTIKGYPVIGGKNDLLEATGRFHWRKAFVAIGCNRSRRLVAEWLEQKGFGFFAAVHPAATIGRDVCIHPGAAVMAGSVVNVDSVVGEHAIVNTGSTVDHDCRVGAYSHIAPGAHLCGTVTIGENSFICAGATIIPNLRIGRNVVVAAGSTVIEDIPDNATVMGSPARIKKRDEIPSESMAPARKKIKVLS